MNHLQQIADHLAEMQLIVLQLMGNDHNRDYIIDNGAKFGYKPIELGAVVSDCNSIEELLIKQYRANSLTQFQLLRAYEVRNSPPIDFTTKTPIFSHTSHNSEVAKDMEQL